MRKQKWLIVIMLFVLLCSCFLHKEEEQKQAVCTYRNKQSNFEVEASYDENKIIQALDVKYKQTFSEKATANLSESDIIDTLTSIFTENGNDHIKVDVSYDQKKRIGNVTLHVDMENVTDEEMIEYKLKKGMKIEAFIKNMQENKFNCEVE
ncbi:MAG: hypothetical protein EOM11_01600 [Erysipelotrichia bacterium]|nr:hypothetical protein [Erysipelotrichia bacterium]